MYRSSYGYFPASLEAWSDEGGAEALGCLPGKGTVTPTPAQLYPGVVPCPITPTRGRSLLSRGSVVAQAVSSVSSAIHPITINPLLISDSLLKITDAALGSIPSSENKGYAVS
jgi:hypothetical protein